MRTIRIATAMPFTGAPKINLASVFGASPNKPFLLRIPVTGERPISYSALDLPEGLVLNDNIISGSVVSAGNYQITLIAQNRHGVDRKKLLLEIRPENVLVTPLLGFTTWNAFGSEVSQASVLNIVKRLTELGITEYGYRYINIDSGWQSQYGGKFDAVMPNQKFPNMKYLTDTLHALGLKCGIYSTPMLNAWGCPKEFSSIPGCTTGEPDKRFASTMGGIGVVRKEKNNVLQWTEWGFDYLKYDWTPTDPVNAELMRSELMRSDRDFGFCVTVHALKEYHEYWSNYCSSYRSNTDSFGNWSNLLDIYRSYFTFMPYINKGHYFDLDMLDIGTCNYSAVGKEFTEDEMIVAYSMRAFFNSPIQISSTLENISKFELSLYCNDEIIAINQDTAFSTATPIYQIEENGKLLHVFEKKLEDQTYAYAFFQLGDQEEHLHIIFDGIGSLRDVWAKEDIGLSDKIDLSMSPHSVRIIKSTKALKTVTIQ